MGWRLNCFRQTSCWGLLLLCPKAGQAVTAASLRKVRKLCAAEAAQLAWTHSVATIDLQAGNCSLLSAILTVYACMQALMVCKLPER